MQAKHALGPPQSNRTAEVAGSQSDCAMGSVPHHIRGPQPPVHVVWRTWRRECPVLSDGYGYGISIFQALSSVTVMARRLDVHRRCCQ